MPRKRTASFAGSANAAWPSLTVEGGGSESWNSPTAPGYSSTRYDGILAYVDGSSNGALGVKYNLPPMFATQLTTSTGTTTTWTATADANTYLFPNAGVQPTVTGSDTLLFAFQTSATVQHYHQIDLTGSQSTGCWAASTFTKVAEQGSLIGGVYYRHTIWVVTNIGTGFGRARLRIKDVQGVTTYTSAIAPTGGGGTGTNNVTVTGAAGLPVLASGTPGGTSGVNSSNTAGASGTGTTATFTLNTATAGNFTRYNNVPFGAFIRVENAILSGNSSNQVLASDNIGTPTETFTVANGYPTGLTDATRVNPTIALSSGSSVGWSGVAVEVKDATTNTNSYFTANALSDNSVQAVMLAGTTTRYSTIVKSLSKSGETQSQNIDAFLNRGLVARYCTVAGVDYWVSLGFSVQSSGKAFVGVGLAAATASTLSVSASTNVALQSSPWVGGASTVNVGGDLRNMALRVRGHSAGGLWIDAKIWDSGVAEPAWPTSEPAAAASNNFGTATNSSTSTTIVMSVNDRRTNANTIAGAAGKSGVSMAYGGTATATVEGTYYTRAWNSWEDDDVVFEVTSADLSGATGLTGNGNITVPTGGSTTLMAASIQPGSQATSDLAANASVIAVATATRTDATGLVGTGTLTADATVIQSESATLSSVSSEIVTSVIVVDLEALTLSGNATTLTVDTLVATVGAATLTGTGTLAADPLGFTLASSTLTAITSELISTAISIVQADATLTGTSTFETVDAISIRFADATLAGTGTFETIPAILVSTGTSTLTGTGTLNAAGATTTERVTLSGTGSLTGSGQAILVATATLTGTTSLTVVDETEYAVQLSGSGTLSGTSTRVLVASATLTGTSSGTSSATRIEIADGTLTGTSGGTSSATHVNVATSSLTGTGTATCAATHVNVATTTCTGIGAMSTDATHVMVVGATCTGQSTVVPSALLEIHTASVLAGISTFTETLVGVGYEAPDLVAVGELLVAGKAVHYIPDTLRNTTSRKLGGALETLPVTADGEPLAGTATLSRKVGTGIMVSVPKE